ncbi:hypothetical protein [Tabrizicola soli]|uniref:Uncharacterized protein n=1 Tax=Tabrizicola soli TaxID=2185115 RepID=A0ABV7DW08_9RHOB|nr:hypothetical protein [Tabrizicola soli]
MWHTRGFGKLPLGYPRILPHLSQPVSDTEVIHEAILAFSEAYALVPQRTIFCQEVRNKSKHLAQ